MVMLSLSIPMEYVYLGIVLSPLAGAILCGLFGQRLGRAGAHWVATLGVGISFLLSLLVFKHMVIDGAEPYNGSVYTWMVTDGFRFEIGFLVDRLTTLMVVVVTFVSLCVHIYTIGYMEDDPGYQRFFSYIELFTFSMLMLVLSNNFLQLFFGWEAVGMVSYLLIGFWYERESAIFAQLKAFLLNRVGDLGFLLGVAVVFLYFNTLDYAQVFSAVPHMLDRTLEIIPGEHWSVITVISILLFVGAMAKSAQIPLHMWLPDSMEGPTPISALIHAATMVTAGVYMVARMSPLYEHSVAALSLVLVIGASGAFLLGLVGLVQNDIKRVIAYSTLSQLGYMMAGCGASAYAAGIFHLTTHACFKALLFLGAGSAIIAMHHDQDVRNMGGLKKYMPITYWTFIVGALALVAFPGFSGYFSKDMIIDAVGLSTIPGATYAYALVVAGACVTALYTFRIVFLVFHGKERMDKHTRAHLQESRSVVTVPLIMLAIPSVIIGWPTIGPLLFGDYFRGSLFVLPEHDVLGQISTHYPGALTYVLHAPFTVPFSITFAGIAGTWFVYLKYPQLAGWLMQRLRLLYEVLTLKYGFDLLNEKLIAPMGRELGRLLWKVGDLTLIDGLLVNGSARTVGWVSGVVRHVQSGYLYHYAFAMIIGLLVLLSWFVIR
jgi:proton-translocating NADH-quinone oxidoreductase, chain L